jgi:hypothetical protein
VVKANLKKGKGALLSKFNIDYFYLLNEANANPDARFNAFYKIGPGRILIRVW